MNTQTIIKYGPWLLFGALAAYAAYIFWPRTQAAEPLVQADVEPTPAYTDFDQWWAQVTWTPDSPDQGDMGDTSLTPL